MLYMLYNSTYTNYGGDEMKLFYNKSSKDPIYYAQLGIRNSKKVTTRNVKRFGKHSELLKITDDPLAYVKEEIRKMNEEYRVGRVEHSISTDYNERVEKTAGRKTTFDSCTIHRFLVYSRIMEPLSKYVTKTKSGEESVVEYILDEDKIAEEEKYDGYYAVATNLTDPAKEVLAVSQKRYQIEDCFRIMKTNFDGRPVNHRLPERIRAHFLICYTALLVYWLLEVMLDAQGTHVTPNNLITTLRNMNVANVHDMDYLALYKGSKTLDALTQLTMLPLDRCHYRPKDLNRIIKKILK